jgi:hypothetical protein
MDRRSFQLLKRAQPNLIQVLMGIDEARQDQQPTPVDDLHRIVDLQIVANRSYALARDEDVGARQLPIAIVEGYEVTNIANKGVGHRLGVCTL